ncbi:hypothetical protein SDC9_193501 [bioreactor metagenome]|uniref:Uncharacterized protein n=1 Tax=bioreactor metagenome TaxID=1076179 RepID=A0A645I582_9ZZZZ
MQHRQPGAGIIDAVVEHRRDHCHLVGVARLLLNHRGQRNHFIQRHARILNFRVNIGHDAVLEVFKELFGDRLHIFTDVKIVGVREKITLQPAVAQVVIGHHVDKLVGQVAVLGIVDEILRGTDLVLL